MQHWFITARPGRRAPAWCAAPAPAYCAAGTDAAVPVPYRRPYAALPSAPLCGRSHSGMVTTACVPFSGARCSTRRPQPIRRQHSRQSSRPSFAPPRKQRRFSSHASSPASGRPQPLSITVSCQKLSHAAQHQPHFAARTAGPQAHSRADAGTAVLHHCGPP